MALELALEQRAQRFVEIRQHRVEGDINDKGHGATLTARRCVVEKVQIRDDRPVTELSWKAALAWRAERQGLAHRAPPSDALAVVARVAGLHAQLMSSAELSLWARVDGLDPAWVERALWEERTLVKTWAMRGTLHLLPAAELGLWLAALGTYRHYRKPAWIRAFGITEPELDALCAAVSEALAGAPLTREALADRVADLTGIPGLAARLREGFGAYLKPSAFQGRLCFAPSDGRNVRFTRPDVWLGADASAPAAATPDGPAAVAEVARRYLAAYAPATREDFGRWWAVSPAEAGRVLRGLGDQIEPVRVEGVDAWMPAGAAAEASALEPAGVVRLLPAFDPLVVGATRVGLITPIARREEVYRPQGWLSPVIAIDGRIVGTWRHERRGTRAEVTLDPWEPLPAAAAAEADALRAALLRGS
jgi:hypothetical protein